MMFELCLVCPESSVQDISDALEALDALSVSVEDADAQSDAERALFGEPGMPPPKEAWQRSKVVALFAKEAMALDAERLLFVQDFFAKCQSLGVQTVEDQDWVTLTQSQFQPVEITHDFWIVPTWHEPPEQAKRFIRLDPGLAFGTGTHPTTRMCLRWIASQSQQQPQPQPFLRVLDYGCGSGILAIAAALHGAQQVDAVDIDEAAIASTLLNAKANGVALQAGLSELAKGVYDCVFANILATPLKVLAPLLCSHVKPEGHLVLAGILERQAQELQLAYAPYCHLHISDQEDGWILMTATL
jgi:ribosomal protein L11 methyltransferase